MHSFGMGLALPVGAEDLGSHQAREAKEARLMAYWDMEAGKVAHFAYCQAMGLEDPVARWDRLPSEEQTAWCLSALAVLMLAGPDDAPLADRLRCGIGAASAKDPRAIFAEAVESGLIDSDGRVREPTD